MIININKKEKKLFLSAVRTDPVQHMPMPQQVESVLLCDPFLFFLNSGIGYLAECSTLDTDKMVMVLMIIKMLIADISLTEIDLTGKSRFTGQRHRTIYRCYPDRRMLFQDQTEKVLNREVTFSFKKNPYNMLTGLTVPDAFPVDIRVEYFEFLHESPISDNDYQYKLWRTRKQPVSD